MPGGDRTGPRGLGQMTGRRMGFCAGYDTPGYANPIPAAGGRFAGWFGGGGRGWRHCYFATGLPRWARSGSFPHTENEIVFLKNEADALQKRLDEIHQRLSELEK